MKPDKITAIIDFLLLHRDKILMREQLRHCGPCGGMKMSRVYSCPEASALGKMLDGIDNG